MLPHILVFCDVLLVFLFLSGDLPPHLALPLFLLHQQRLLLLLEFFIPPVLLQFPELFLLSFVLFSLSNLFLLFGLFLLSHLFFLSDINFAFWLGAAFTFFAYLTIQHFSVFPD